MPIEIREVVIKAKLENTISTSSNSNIASLSEEKLQEIKSELMEAILEKMEEKLWKYLDQ